MHFFVFCKMLMMTPIGSAREREREREREQTPCREHRENKFVGERMKRRRKRKEDEEASKEKGYHNA